MSDIFISYAQSDRAKAQMVARFLEREGWSVWWDTRIAPGETFDEVIEEALARAKCVVVLWSKTSVKSRWVKAESAEANDRGILIPAFIEDDIKLPLAFRNLHAARLTDWQGQSDHSEFDAIRTEIAKLLHRPVSARKGPDIASSRRPSRKRTVLVVDDDPVMRSEIDLLLQAWGYEVFQAGDGFEALQLVDRHDPDIVISDVVMPQMSGLELLTSLKAGNPYRPVLLLSARGSIDMAVEAMKQGARDFMTKPLTDIARLKAVLVDTERELQLRRESYASAPLVENEQLTDFVANSKPMRAVFELIEDVAPRDVSVMITGETGTGKEVVARTIHNMSRRGGRPFVAMNAAAIPESLIESELFGHERGAFTGAVATRQGVFEQADSGTLFLDEIAEMPMALQPKLLRVLAEGKVRRLGSGHEFEVDVRVLAATNRDPLKAIETAKLREDLYYRLNVVLISLPPLRARLEDIPPLVRHFLTKFNARHRTGIAGTTDEAMTMLKAYSWPGNVRELSNVVERSVILAKGDWIAEQDLPPYIRNTSGTSPSTTVADAERELILKTLEQAGNNKAEAARQLGVDVKTIYNKLKRYKIEP